MTPMHDDVFSTSYWVPKGINIMMSTTAQVRLEDEIFRNPLGRHINFY
jgi:hypothetical protein